MVDRPGATLVTAVTCPVCKDSVFSRCEQDSRKCSCGDLTVSGGFSFLEILMAPNILPEDVTIREVPLTVTKEDLCLDWTTGRNLFGRISEA